jgi:predicted N-acetyltransferase YhbS
MTEQARPNVMIRPLRETELNEADRIFRLAFGTFLGLPDPLMFMGDAGYVRTRWTADPSSAFAAEMDGELVGTNFASNWGSVGFFGPVSVRPDLWDAGVGARLVEPAIERFSEWGVEYAGLFTWSHSPKHTYLYQKFDFWARFLTAIMSKSVVEPRMVGGKTAESPWSRFSTLAVSDREAALAACGELTSAIYDGLDVSGEIRAVASQRLGDTLLLYDDAGLAGLAVCHYGAGTEAGSGACYVKFGAIQPGPDAGRHFDQLLDVCEALAAEEGMQVVVAGVNLACHETYRALLAHGFRVEIQGVAMQRANASGYHQPGVYVIDDWR